MNLSGSLAAALVGLGFFSTGCAERAQGADVEDSEARRGEAAESLTVDPLGTGGQNGLRVTYFRPNRGNIDAALYLPLLQNDGLNPAVTALFNAPGGPETLKYLLRCSAPAEVCSGHDGVACTPMLGSTEPWLKHPLDVTAGARADLWACLATHLNPYGVTVPIRLTGAPVLNQPAGTNDEFQFEEALWTALPPTFVGGLPTFRVWPLHDIERYCGKPIANQSFNLRYCGKASCGPEFSVRGDLGECAEGPGGHMTCLGQPAIKSWLKSTDVSKLHPRCTSVRPPPQLDPVRAVAASDAPVPCGPPNSPRWARPARASPSDGRAGRASRARVGSNGRSVAPGPFATARGRVVAARASPLGRAGRRARAG